MVASVNTQSCSILVVLGEESTLYMRPAAMLTKIANQYESDVIIEHKSSRANGKSLMEIITLGVRDGGNFKVSAIGRDAAIAIKALKNFLMSLFADKCTGRVITGKNKIMHNVSGQKADQKEEMEMKQKKQTIVKLHHAPVKQIKNDKKKTQTFTWPATGNVNAVCLAGDFNNWKPEPMEKKDTKFHATVKLDPGVYQYKFVVDGEWQTDPSASANAQNDFGTTNSVLLVD